MTRGWVKGPWFNGAPANMETRAGYATTATASRPTTFILTGMSNRCDGQKRARTSFRTTSCVARFLLLPIEAYSSSCRLLEPLSITFVESPVYDKPLDKGGRQRLEQPLAQLGSLGPHLFASPLGLSMRKFRCCLRRPASMMPQSGSPCRCRPNHSNIVKLGFGEKASS